MSASFVRDSSRKEGGAWKRTNLKIEMKQSQANKMCIRSIIYSTEIIQFIKNQTSK